MSIPHQAIADWHEQEFKRLYEKAKNYVAQAKRHKQMALEIRAEYLAEKYTPEPEKKILTAQQLREYLRDRGGRPIHLAGHFGVEKEEIDRIVAQPDSGIEVQERGWLKLRDSAN